MTTMQAAVVKEFGKDLIIEGVSVPTPAPGQAPWARRSPT
jgi:D-arabinose 1-dehydrogenase-like Zn-dependent alcohol dehydrogenase